jgi:hypothetical protein
MLHLEKLSSPGDRRTQIEFPVPSSRGAVPVTIIPLKGWGCANKIKDISGNY